MLTKPQPPRIHLPKDWLGKEAPQTAPGDPAPCTGIVTAKRPNHVWHVDLTAVPTSVGFWAPITIRWAF